MKFLNSMVSTLWLSLTSFSLIQAGPLASRADSPPPTRPFTVTSYESPYAIGQGLTGYNLTARNGNFYLSPKANVQKAVLFVSSEGKAYLDSKKTQPVYIDTSSGLLAYATPPPAGAIFVDFVHLGHGNSVFFQGDGYTASGTSTFQWLGQQEDDLWFVCAAAGGEYKVYKIVTFHGGTPDLNDCTGVDLSALDYTGPNPAVDSYS